MRRNITFICAFMLLSACTDDNIRYEAARARENDISSQIAKHGFAVVGKTPSGKPLYMKEIDVGVSADRVYFSDGSLTAQEYCGKNCSKTIITKEEK